MTFFFFFQVYLYPVLFWYCHSDHFSSFTCTAQPFCWLRLQCWKLLRFFAHWLLWCLQHISFWNWAASSERALTVDGTHCSTAHVWNWIHHTTPDSFHLFTINYFGSLGSHNRLNHRATVTHTRDFSFYFFPDSHIKHSACLGSKI